MDIKKRFNESGKTRQAENAKQMAHNHHQALKVMLENYNKHQKVCVGMDDDWLRHLGQFGSLAQASSPTVRVIHFQHSLKPGSQAYHYYIKFRDEAGMSWDKITKFFKERYNSPSGPC